VENETPIRKAYKKPQATKLTLEQAKFKIHFHSGMGTPSDPPSGVASWAMNISVRDQTSWAECAMAMGADL
jgi:hypothetical protein